MKQYEGNGLQQYESVAVVQMCVSIGKIFDSPHSSHSVSVLNVFQQFLLAFGSITLSSLLYHEILQWVGFLYFFHHHASLVFLLLLNESGQKTKKSKHRILDHMKC